MKKYNIYQIKNDSQVARGIKFSGLEELEEYNLRSQLTLDIYQKVFTGEIEDGDILVMLDRIFSKFQGKKPADFTGHSVSVSDMVEMDGKYYYCDHYTWKEITFTETKTTETPEKDLYSEVADILKEGNLYGDINTYDNQVEVSIEWGDWKHEHGYLRYLMEQKGFIETNEEITEEDGSDCYSAVHTFKKAA